MIIVYIDEAFNTSNNEINAKHTGHISTEQQLLVQVNFYMFNCYLFVKHIACFSKLPSLKMADYHRRCNFFFFLCNISIEL